MSTHLKKKKKKTIKHTSLNYDVSRGLKDQVSCREITTGGCHKDLDRNVSAVVQMIRLNLVVKQDRKDVSVRSTIILVNCGCHMIAEGVT